MDKQDPKVSDNIPNDIEKESTANNIEDIGLPIPTSPKPNFKSGIIWIISIALIIVSFFAGYGTGGFTKNKQINSLEDQIDVLEKNEDKLNEQISELEQTVADLDLGIIEIPYQNSQFNFQFYYTSDLELIDYSSSTDFILGLEKDTYSVSVVKVGRKQTDEEKYLNQDAVESLTISGAPATKHEFPKGIIKDGNRTDPFVAYKILKEGESNEYILEFYGSITLSDAQKRILNTFKFVNLENRRKKLF